MRQRDMTWIERRAADIAIRLIYDRTFCVSAKEMAGWMRAGDGREPRIPSHTREWHAGWQAARIWYDAPLLKRLPNDRDWNQVDGISRIWDVIYELRKGGVEIEPQGESGWMVCGHVW